MARQHIDIGTTANDGTGDTLRDAMDKSNDNFIELYAGGSSSFLADFLTDAYNDGSADNVDFAAWLTALNGSYTRGGSYHNYINSSGYLAAGSADTLRIQHDPISHVPLGVLIEPSRTNILSYSDDVAATAWAFSNQNVTRTNDATAGITGGTTMATVIESAAAAADHRMFYYSGGTLVTSGNHYTLSFYVKPIGDRGLQISPSQGIGGTVINFFSKSATGGWQMEEMNDGIFRVWVSATATGSGVCSIQFFPLKDGTSNYDGDGVSGFGIEKGQLEQVTTLGDHPSSYIDKPTGTNTTRSADALTFDVDGSQLFYISGTGSYTTATPSAGSYNFPPDPTSRILRRITTTLPDTDVAGKVLSIYLKQDDITGLTTADSPLFAGLSISGDKLQMGSTGSMIFKSSSDGLLQITRSISEKSGRSTLFGYQCARDATTLSNSLVMGTETAKTTTSIQTSTILGDTAAATATTISGSDIAGNEAGNGLASISGSVITGNLAASRSGGSSSGAVVHGHQAARGMSTSASVVQGYFAGKPASGTGTLTSCVISGAYAGNNITGDRTGLILIGYQAEAPTATTDNYLNIGDLIKGDLSAMVAILDTDTVRLTTQKTPASASATGTKGDIVHDTDYIYVCTATDTWKRVALATW